MRSWPELGSMCGVSLRRRWWLCPLAVGRSRESHGDEHSLQQEEEESGFAFKGLTQRADE